MSEYARDWSHPTYDEGGVLSPGSTVLTNDTGKPFEVFTAEQMESLRTWLRDHYRDGTFRCPSGGSEGGDACHDSPGNPDA